ncbi:MAG: DUF11 domain-containing protein [Patescibacteria group bacterium]|nr:DUF11 domain-containing protein [Patescibacteria group bacterium]
MNNLKTQLNKGLLLLSMVVFMGILAVPLMPAKTAFAMTCNSATLDGNVNTGGVATLAWFEWGQGGSLDNTTPQQSFTVSGSYSQYISGLTENTVYSFRAMASNRNGNYTGETRTFTTPSCNQISTPTVTLNANPSTINSGNSSTLTWYSTNATSCSAFWTGSTATSGSGIVTPTGTTTYTTTCTNSTGQSASATATVYVNNNQNVPTVSIYASPSNVNYNGTSTITWYSTNASYCTASGGGGTTNGWYGTQNLSGSFYTGPLTNTTTFNINCSNGTGSAVASTTVYVNNYNNQQYPVVSIYASPSNVNYNGTSTITWYSTNATYCTASGGTNGWYGTQNLSGSFYTGPLTNTTTFNINCSNGTGNAVGSTTVYVTGGNIFPVTYQPTVTITADQTNLAFNGATTIRWSTTNATSCNASGGSVGWAGIKSIGPGAFYTGSLTGTRTYSITCTNGMGSASDFVTVNVNGQVLGVTTNRTPTSLVLVTSTVDRNRPIVPTLDNTNPCPGDDINYSITYQNIGNASITGLVLRVDLPAEVTYLSSNPSNATISGQTLIFNLGTLRANGQGTVTARVHVRENISAGAPLNFPATLSYVDPSGAPQSVSANVSANVCGTVSGVSLGANVFGAGFLPNSIFGWLLLLILILVLILLAKYLFGQSFQRKTTTTLEQPSGRKTTTVTQ